jgi:alkanesulfonate monooxygenase SsuD/methylene tetrahydromethanopterin reductase-like flavin-dependent oxidoreductase (luciferase family)
MDAGGHETVEPFVALGFCAGVTSRMRVIPHMTVAPYRNPFMLAKAITTLDIVSGGRATIGLGSGYLRSEFRSAPLRSFPIDGKRCVDGRSNYRPRFFNK